MDLEVLKTLVSQRKIKWTTHVATRIQERGISRADVINCINTGEIIEPYPEDYPNPSCLIFGLTLNDKVLHVVAGFDSNFVYIITAYYPSLEKFESDLKTRRRKES